MTYRLLGLMFWIVWAPTSVAQTRDGAGAAGRPEISTLRVPVRPDSRLWLEGTSNVRDWTCKATEMDAAIQIETERLASSDFTARAVRGVSVRVPVRMLKCGDRHMEANMYDALKAPKPPAVSYITAEFNSIPASGTDLDQISTKGRLAVAGVERTVEMTVRTDRLPDGTRRAIGQVPILMTDFGITPPRPWMGILRTGNRVVIQFEIFISPDAIRLAQSAKAAESGSHQ